MIFAFSTSSRIASVAVFDDAGNVLWAGAQDAPQSASSASMALLNQARLEQGIKVENGTLFLADLGPGSFTGVRVGIVLAKTFAFLFGKPCGGLPAFDLVSVDRTVVLPLKRGEVFVRRPGEEPFPSTVAPPGDFVGYGLPDAEPVYPDAARFAGLIDRIDRMEAEDLVPKYLIEPSISIPKKRILGVNA